MTIGLRYGDADATETSGLKAGFLYFDAVTAYSKSLRGEVSKNPIATGRYVSDSFTADNTVIQLSAVISFANFSNDALILDVSGNAPTNYNPQPGEVFVLENTSTLTNLLPSSISQFLPSSNATVALATDLLKTDFKDFIYNIFEILMSGEFYNEKTGRLERRLRTVELYEYVGNDLAKIYPASSDNFGLVLTAADVKEDADTGDALVCDLTFERVKFVRLKTTALPKDVVASLKTKSTAKQKKGVVNTKPVEKNTDDLSPEEQAQVDKFNKNKADQ